MPTSIKTRKKQMAFLKKMKAKKNPNPEHIPQNPVACVNKSTGRGPATRQKDVEKYQHFVAQPLSRSGLGVEPKKRANLRKQWGGVSPDPFYSRRPEA